MKLTRRALSGAAALLAMPSVSRAQTAPAWPSRPIRLVVPFPGGGATDVTARVIGERLSAVFGQPVVVDNRPGAGGNIGADQVAKADPDGHTILMTTIGTASINQFLYSRMPFDPMKDLTAVALVNLVANGVIVANDVPANTFAEFLALAKAKPGTLNYGTPGNGTSGHLCGEYLKAKAGVDITHIPYRGSATVIPDLLAGRLQVAIDNLPPYLPYIRDKKMKLLAVTSKDRWFATPEAPAVGEAIPGFEAVAWFGFQAPAKTPRAVIEKIANAVQEQMKDPAVDAKLREVGSEPHYLGPQAFEQFIAAENIKWKDVVRLSGARLD